MHRDIKPENIVFQSKKELFNLKVIDLGLATFTDVDKYEFNILFSILDIFLQNVEHLASLHQKYYR